MKQTEPIEGKKEVYVKIYSNGISHKQLIKDECDLLILDAVLKRLKDKAEKSIATTPTASGIEEETVKEVLGKHISKMFYYMPVIQVTDHIYEAMKEYANQFKNPLPYKPLNGEWRDCKDDPLFTFLANGNWECTENGDREFIAAVPYENIKQPGKNLWWIRHCVIEDGIGLCVIGDDYNEPAGWELQSVTHWQPLPSPPKQPVNEQLK